ncbi:MAG: pilus assembly protein [Rhodospirillaceae bacterium]|nr:pilus assembly protein [Rhodospirillaceae bacterium]
MSRIRTLIIRHMTAAARQERGAAAVEFALVAPLLVAILAGILEAGLYLWNKHSIEFAIEETGRSVMTKSSVTADDVTADLKSRLIGVDADALAATVATETIGLTTYVTITASYTYSFFLAGDVGFGPIAIVSKTRVPLNATQ